MKFKIVTSALLIGALSLAVAAPVLAQGAGMLQGAEAIAKRQELMKDSGKTMKSLGGLSGAEAVAASQHLVDNFAALGSLWPEDSQTGDTKALPAIWTDQNGFMAAFMNASTAAAAVLTTAEAGDAAAYGAALKTMGGTCGTCHQTYRQANP